MNVALGQTRRSSLQTSLHDTLPWDPTSPRPSSSSTSQYNQIWNDAVVRNGPKIHHDDGYPVCIGSTNCTAALSQATCCCWMGVCEDHLPASIQRPSGRGIPPRRVQSASPNENLAKPSKSRRPRLGLLKEAVCRLSAGHFRNMLISRLEFPSPPRLGHSTNTQPQNVTKPEKPEAARRHIPDICAAGSTQNSSDSAQTGPPTTTLFPPTTAIIGDSMISRRSLYLFRAPHWLISPKKCPHFSAYSPPRSTASTFMSVQTTPVTIVPTKPNKILNNF